MNMKTVMSSDARIIRMAAFICALLFCAAPLPAQEKVRIRDYAQLNVVSAGGSNAPFWLVSGRNGLSSLDIQNGYARYGIGVDGVIGKKGKWRYNAGLDLKVGYNQGDNPIVHQFYFDISYKWLTLSAGSKERMAEMRDFCMPGGLENNSVTAMDGSLSFNGLSELGTGGLVYSGNSASLPQIRIEVPEYVNMGKGGWFGLRGHIAYGVFLDNGFQRDFTSVNPKAKYNKYVLYHSKALFLRAGNAEKFPLEAEAGLEMHSQFGGDVYTHADGKILSMPTKLKDFFKALIPTGGDERTPEIEQTNISGNQIGNWHLALTLHTAPVDIRLYGEHMFEDFSQLFFFEYQSDINGKREVVYYPWRDIMLGISLKNKSGFLDFISNVQYEFVSTYDQSGACYNDPNKYFQEQMDGWDNYYNHAIYSGWHYYGMPLGNPLVFSPLYNGDGSLEFKGNRLKAHHVGVNGAFGKRKEFMYRLMYTYSENWGTYENPFLKKRYTTSLCADIMYAPYGRSWLLSASVAHDTSNFIGNNTGVMLSFAKVGIFK